ncbi:hypothetical protein QQU25_001673 [Salmonella enterica]|nr:hypothetical protein [Salmonella enterica]
MTTLNRTFLISNPNTSSADSSHPQPHNRKQLPGIRARASVERLSESETINRLKKIIQQNISNHGGMNEISHINLINKINSNHILPAKNKDHNFFISQSTHACTQLKKAICHADICMRKLEDYKLNDFSTHSDSEVFKALNQAVKAQYSLKEKLKIYGKTVTGDMLEYISLCAEDCERRISEMLNVASQANNSNRKNNIDIMKNIGENLDNVVTNMHGTPQAMQEFYKEVNELLIDLDILEKNNNGINNKIAYHRLENKTRNLQFKLNAMLSQNKTYERTKLIYDDIIFNTINKSLNLALGRCKIIATANINPVFENSINQLFQPTINTLKTAQDKIPYIYTEEKEVINYIIQYTEKLQTNLQEQAKRLGGLSELNSVHRDVQKMIEYVNTWSYPIIGKLPQSLIKIVRDSFNRTIYNSFDYRVFSSGLIELSQLSIKYASGNFTNTGRYLTQAFYNSPGSDALIECYSRGIPPKYLEKDSSSERLKSAHTLGCGSVNEVTLCVYNAPHGQHPIEKVFKPEYVGRYGLGNLQLHCLDGNNFSEMLVRNIASSEVAKYLGCQNIVSTATAGVYKKQFGLFMNKAPGKTPCDLVSTGGITQSQLESILSICKTNNKLEIAKANLRHELNNLEWADALAGQIDRHSDNYLIDIDKLTGNIKVTGIDNDASFSVALTGIGIISVNNLNISVQDRNKLTPYFLRTSQGKLYLDDYHSPVIDIRMLDHIGQETIINITGINQKIVPDLISQETYDALMSIDAVDYAETLSELLPPANVQAALKRLESAKQHASELYRNNRVISNWQDPDIEIYYNNELLDYENKVNRGISYPQNANLDLSLYLRDFHYSVLLV